MFPTNNMIISISCPFIISPLNRGWCSLVFVVGATIQTMRAAHDFYFYAVSAIGPEKITKLITAKWNLIPDSATTAEG